ncbi:hypothetical protein TKK_0013401 [Trichogramma kaykai]|uniref:VPS9 domain-containing protein n=1 Tax=Trichogramma kaykai TaxID=54128 RepID=A0ABD2WHS6_9HYME
MSESNDNDIMCEGLAQHQDELLHLWHGANELELQLDASSSILEGHVTKLRSCQDRLFIKTTSGTLYYGDTVQAQENDKRFLELKKSQFNVIDLATNSKHLFLVLNNGSAVTVEPRSLKVVDTVVIKDDVKYCIHGYKQDNEAEKIVAIAVNDNASLFLTDNGQLWVIGDHPQIDIQSQVPKKVNFFDGRVISDIACGSSFYVVLVRKIPRSSLAHKDDADSNNESDEVFVRSCSQCLNNLLPSPLSLNLSGSGTTKAQNISLTKEVKSFDSNTSKDDVFRPVEKEKPTKKSNDSMIDSEINDEEPTEPDKDPKRNVILINTEAAKHFFTRQLSWVSTYSSGGSKDDASCTDNVNNDNPAASLIKQNVSSVANLVYEGVKTVGDKVATLSRHVSGSSDPNEIARPDADDENFEELEIDELYPKKSCLAIATTPGSLNSSTSSEHDLLLQYQRCPSERINLLVRSGSSALNTELWTWGDTKYGQLGGNDAATTTRQRPRQVTMLNHCGVKKIACGDNHTLAMTLDGRVFTWGRNNYMQVADCSQLDQKTPQIFASNFVNHLSHNERAMDIAAGNDYSLVMMGQKIIFMGKQRSSGVMSTLEIPNIKDDHKLVGIFCSQDYKCCTSVLTSPMSRSIVSCLDESLIEAQVYLTETLLTQQHLVAQLQKKIASVPTLREFASAFDELCRYHRELLSFIALHAQELTYFHEQAILNSLDTDHYPRLVIVANVEECVAVYKAYLQALCDLTAISGLSQIAKVIDVLPTLLKHFQDKLKCDVNSDITNEALVVFALHLPLLQASRYAIFIKNLITNDSVSEKEQLQNAMSKWESLSKLQTKRIQEAEATKCFWEGPGKIIEQLRSLDRRMIRESRTHSISLYNAGRFSSHRFILLNDVFVHITGGSYVAHLLSLLWVELLQDSDQYQNAMSITTPEENFILYTPTAADRSDWFHAFQSVIKANLRRNPSHSAPQIRSGFYSFSKNPTYKDASYTGQWLNGKPHGTGKLEWFDNKMYVGQFYKGAIQGIGRMEMPTQGVYEGQWKDGLQNGYGVMNFINGDVYEGYFKDGLPHGHGVKKEGHFMASAASIYIGEWSCGVKQGYGVMDDIKTGEKYLGSWYNNTKHGNGLIVTLDGIYYEGAFIQDVFQGHGIMVLEDGMHYEGEFKSVGIFGGKGILTFTNEEKLEGNFSGAWNEGIKVTATLRINNKTVNKVKNTPPSFGKLCAPTVQKWEPIFRQFYQELNISELKNNNSKAPAGALKSESQKLWHNVAAVICKSQRNGQKRQCFNSNICLSSSLSPSKEDSSKEDQDLLNRILYFEQDQLSIATYMQIHAYLTRAFESQHHPLGTLLNELASVYTATYGGVRVHPLLLEHAVDELKKITKRIYEAVTLFFPTLPKGDIQLALKPADDSEEEKIISADSILHPILLPRVYSALFVLYALHNKKNDDAYWERLIKWNKQPTNTLLVFLGVDGKFWQNFDTESNDVFLNEAIETLQQLKTTFSAVEKLMVIRNTHYQIVESVQKRLENCKLPADQLIPIFYFVVVRAGVLQLGSEIHFIKDFMEPYLESGEIGYCFSTILGIYDHILHEKISMVD